MSTTLGRDGVARIGSNTIAEVKNWSVSRSNNVIEDSEKSDTDASFKAGRNSWTATIECHWDDTDATGQEAMTIGASVSLELGPEGAGVGAYQFSGTGIIQSIEESSPDEGVTARTFGIQGTGALTIGTF